MSESFSESYKAAGVDVTAGYKAVEMMKSHVARTMTAGMMGGIGGFGGAFELDLTGITKPVLVSGTDGVGTKLKIAFLLDKHDTVGIDCVAMCVNDIICCGAKPLLFLDYIAMGKNIPEKVADIVKGVADACVETGCALVGGETAEMPGCYPIEEYDMAGFSVGVVDKDKMLDPQNVKPRDVMLALASSGIHSNGFSLVRKVFDLDNTPRNIFREVFGTTLGQTLLTPTKLYVKPILELLDKVNVKSIVNITGGGFFENIPRALNKNVKAVINRENVRVLPIFDLIAQEGNIPSRDMFNTFNMGVGMIVILPSDEATKALEILRDAGEDAYILGQIQASGESDSQTVEIQGL